MNVHKEFRPPGRETGVAILAITMLILLVATIGTLMVGRLGVAEQRNVGTESRGKEVYSAAIAGLEHGVNWLKGNQGCGPNYEFLTWLSDDDDDGVYDVDDGNYVAGERAFPGDITLDTSGTTPVCVLSVSQPADLAMNAGDYGLTVTYELLTDYTDWPAERDGDGKLMNIRPVMMRVTSAAQPVTGDTHLGKTVSVDVVIGAGGGLQTIAGGDPGQVEAPPIVIEGCITGSITGNPAINYNMDGSCVDSNGDGDCDDPGENLINYGIATTGGLDTNGDGVNDQDVDACMPTSSMEGHLTFCEVDDYPDSCPNNADTDSGDPTLGEFKAALDSPSSLWSTIFGDITKEDLLAMEAADPLNVIVVDGATLHYPIQQQTYTGWNSNQWHDDLPYNLPSKYEQGDVGTDGEPINPVILFFDEAVDCPSINGSTTIVGIVYYEKENCTNEGWGGGTVYGTFAKAGDLTKWNSNAVVIATSLDFTNSAGSGAGSGANRELPSNVQGKVIGVPGTWKDY